MQQGCASQLEPPRARAPEVELREALMQEPRILLQIFSQAFDPTTKQIQNRRNLVFGDTARFQQNIDARSQLRRASVSADDIIQRGARIFPLWIIAVRIG